MTQRMPAKLKAVADIFLLYPIYVDIAKSTRASARPNMDHLRAHGAQKVNRMQREPLESTYMQIHGFLLPDPK